MKSSSRFVVMVAVCVATALNAAADDEAKVQSLIDLHCAECHGADKQEGSLRLDQLATKRWSDYALFNELVARIEDGEMPPAEASKRLAASERTKLLSLLKNRLKTLDDQQLAGKYKKLTAHEYNNTLIDIFGAPVAKLQNLPFDSESDFKKVGEHQAVTSYAVKKYYAVAADYLDRHILVNEPPIREITLTQPDNPKQWIGTSRFNQTMLGPIVGTGNAPRFMLRSPVTTYAEEGEYEITFAYRMFYLGDRERFDSAKDYEPADAVRPPTIVCPSEMNVVSESVRVGDRRLGDKKPYECRIDQPIRVTLNKDLKFLNFRTQNNFGSRLEDDARYQAILNLDLSEKERSAKIKVLREKLKPEYKAMPKLRMLITGAKIRGPFNKQPSVVHTRLLGELKRSDSFDACRPILRNVADKLFRRPVSDGQMSRYLATAKSEHEDTGNTYAAVKVAVNAMLCSPNFVFKFEGDQNELDDYMIAARLSYFLWNSTPDDELLKLAAAGKLKDPNVRREQAMRMLNDRDMTNRFTQNFTHQWLGLHKFGQFAPNEAYLEARRFANLQPHIAREPQEFFNELLHHNLSTLNFIDSDFVVWNRHLHQTYADKSLKIEYDREQEDDVWQRMLLSENSARIRGGLSSMPVIMSLTTDGENTQPILRGVWVARKLLGLEIEAPATVPAIEINLENVSKPREVLAKHKADRSCYACHVKFDYIGLALENYDVLGRFTTNYVHPVLDEKGRPSLIKKDTIDSISETPAGEKMPGVAGLKSHLLKNRDVVMRNLTEKLFSYALAREVRYKDRRAIDELMKSMRENDYRLRDLIFNIVASESFVQR